MKIKLLLLILNICSLCYISSSQNYILYGDKTFGTIYPDGGYEITNIGNNELIITGATRADTSGDKTDPNCSTVPLLTDVWILKIDTAFNILWNKSMGGTGGENFPRLIASSSRIIFSCVSNSDSSCEKSENNRDTTNPNSTDYWICMMDTNGNKTWDKTYGGTVNEYVPEIVRLSTGDYILGGISNSPAGADKSDSGYVAGQTDYWIVKLDSVGNKIWDKVYGGLLSESAGSQAPYYDLSILPCEGADFILAGTTDSPPSNYITDTCRGVYDIWLIKLDSAGNKIWDKRYGGTGLDLGGHIIHTDDNGFILCGTTDSPQGLDVSDTAKGGSDFWVIKLDSLGNKLWDKRYGGSQGQQAAWIEKAPGGGYWVSGYTTSDSSIDVSQHKYGVQDYWILKIDNMGNKLWDRRFGGPTYSWGSTFVVMPDSSIFLIGTANTGITAVKTDSGVGMSDYWVVHFKYTDSGTGINENTYDNNSISIYPNPTKGKILLNTNTKENGEIFIYDVMGKELYNKKNVLLNRYEIDISGFDKGIYFFRINTAENIFTKRVVKM